jgi:hypothetical protein
MVNNNSRIKEKIAIDNISGLLEKAAAGKNIIVRDDQEEFTIIRDAARICRKKGKRFWMIDTGIFDLAQLEWIIEAGADIYTSNKTGREFQEMDFLSLTSRDVNNYIALLIENMPEEEKESNLYSSSELFLLGESGIYFHASNKTQKFPFDFLEELAFKCRQGKSWLVYYHYGSLDPSLISIAEKGGWIHISDQNQENGMDILFIKDLIKTARSNGSNLILHLEKKLPFNFIEEIIQAGAFVLFKTAPIDYKSPLRKLEKLAIRKTLNPRTYYLHTTLMP